MTDLLIFTDSVLESAGWGEHRRWSEANAEKSRQQWTVSQISFKGRKGKRAFHSLPINEALISKYAVSDNPSVFSLSLINPLPLLPILQEHVIRPTL